MGGWETLRVRGCVRDAWMCVKIGEDIAVLRGKSLISSRCSELEELERLAVGPVHLR